MARSLDRRLLLAWWPRAGGLDSLGFRVWGFGFRVVRTRHPLTNQPKAKTRSSLGFRFKA